VEKEDLWLRKMMRVDEKKKKSIDYDDYEG
jgi:hypothetical protein